jgi:O-methyltransferase involved in polyketide biosynthesis
MSEEPKIPVALAGVPETLLWTLYYRAQEAARPDAVLADPLVVQLVQRIDYPFLERLGQGVRRAQWQGLRARTFDQAISEFLAAHPGGTVVALGEGLETQFWRVDDGRAHWVGVDLPETATLRRQILPAHDRRRQFDISVLDEAWMDEVDPTRGVMITAQGLLMYLPRDDVHRLITCCAARFPHAQMVFDAVPHWTSSVTTRGQAAPRTTTMPAPAMPWFMNQREAAAVRALPGVESVQRLHPPRGRGPLYSLLLPLADRLPLTRSLVLSIWSARFR